MDKILVVEDNTSVRENLIELLSSSGYEVSHAENGIEAIRSFRLNKPDLILCDIMMPIMDGFEFYSLIREEEAMINTPFIFLTAKADLDTHDRAMSLGVEDYILKPYNSLDLLRRIETRLEKRKKLEKKFEELKDDIALYVPHELQTPIFPIIGYSEMILSDFDNLTKLEITEMVKGIHSSAVRLKNRMEKFNKFAELRIQSSEGYVNNKEDLEAKTLIRNELIASLFRTNRDKLDIDVEEAEVNISELDLNNLLFELVENALKFEPQKEKVRVVGKITGDKYILSVQNKGEKFDINQIEGFTQIERRKKQQIGNGLGVAIVSLIAKKYNLKVYSQNNDLNKVFVEFSGA